MVIGGFGAGGFGDDGIWGWGVWGQWDLGMVGCGGIWGWGVWGWEIWGRWDLGLGGLGAGSKLDPRQARMERDLSNKKIYQEEELPESGAGSEFNRRLREEARRKKYGIVLREFRAEDQPWLLRVNGKAGRK